MLLGSVKCWVCRQFPNWEEGAPRQVSEVCEWYVTQQDLVCAWMGLSFNLCVVPTLTFCPYILDRWTDYGLDGIRREEKGLGFGTRLCMIK